MRRIKEVKWTIFAGAILGVVFCALVSWQVGEEAQENQKQSGYLGYKERRNIGSARNSRAGSRRETPNQKTSVRVPAEYFLLTNVHAFDNNTGKLSDKVVAALEITQDELPGLQTLFEEFFTEYCECEVECGQVIVQAEGSYIPLNSCETAVSASYKRFLDALNERLGEERGEALGMLVHKQLRHGGHDIVEIAYEGEVDTEDLKLVVRFVTDEGKRGSGYHSEFVSEFDFSTHWRWKHLSSIVGKYAD